PRGIDASPEGMNRRDCRTAIVKHARTFSGVIVRAQALLAGTKSPGWRWYSGPLHAAPARLPACPARPDHLPHAPQPTAPPDPRPCRPRSVHPGGLRLEPFALAGGVAG